MCVCVGGTHESNVPWVQALSGSHSRNLGSGILGLVEGRPKEALATSCWRALLPGDSQIPTTGNTCSCLLGRILEWVFHGQSSFLGVLCSLPDDLALFPVRAFPGGC